MYARDVFVFVLGLQLASIFRRGQRMHVLHIGEVWNYLSPVHFGHNNFSDHRHQMIFKRLLSDQYHQNSDSRHHQINISMIIVPM